MSVIARRLATGLVALSAVVGTTVVATPAANAATTTSSCKVTWGSLDKGVNLTSAVTGTAVADVRTGHHTCYDRVVFELAGKAGPVVATYGPGKTGPMALVIATSTKLVPVGVKPGAELPTGFRTVKGMVNLGTEQGLSGVAVVTRARLPYRLFLLKGPGNHNRIVVDVAHTW